ncbi:CDK5 and ABL1 enzyme substrate 2-like isoform X2 [Brachyhypopomus gauderio]|uniref:CDK5 and ABL1 enzyme substrate 2-like isoform X2 n=1 Tax=Brachyhypopomus gauderio TaxID=698409 RepID=UPI004042A5C6
MPSDQGQPQTGGAACPLLATKSNSDLQKQEDKQLMDELEENFHISRMELIAFEFNVLVSLEMVLYLPESRSRPTTTAWCSSPEPSGPS